MKSLVILSLLLFTMSSQAAVWQAAGTWTEEAESRYSRWIQSNFKADFFANPKSPWYGIATDCADAAYAARIIFSYENSLPVAFTNIESMRPALTQSMSDWDHLPAQERVRAFIRRVSELTSTQTLGYDTVPVAIDRAVFRPGIIFLNPTLSRDDENLIGTRGGHAETIVELEENGYIRSLYSTTPAKVRMLITSRNPYSWPVSSLGGYRAWKGSVVQSSNEQFRIADWRPGVQPTRQQIYQWHESIRRSLRQRPPTIDERIGVVTESICNLWQGRVDAVHAAWKAIQANGGRCLGASLMDEHSTHKRDARLREAYGQLNDLMYWKKNHYGPVEATGRVNDAKPELQGCLVQVAPGHPSDAWELFLKLIDGHLNPNASWNPAVRWGYRAPSGELKCR